MPSLHKTGYKRSRCRVQLPGFCIETCLDLDVQSCLVNYDAKTVLSALVIASVEEFPWRVETVIWRDEYGNPIYETLSRTKISRILNYRYGTQTWGGILRSETQRPFFTRRSDVDSETTREWFDKSRTQRSPSAQISTGEKMTKRLHSSAPESGESEGIRRKMEEEEHVEGDENQESEIKKRGEA